MLAKESIEQLRRLIAEREKRDAAKQAAEMAEKDYREVEAEVWDSFDESEVTKPITVDLGPPYGEVRFQPKETYYGRVIDAEAYLEYLENRAVIDEFTEPKIRMGLVHEDIRERLEQGQSLPPGADFYARRYVQITRQK